MLPESLKAPLERHLARVRALHQRDLAAGGGLVWLPDAMETKDPSAAKGWAWQWVFPAKRR